MTAKPFRNLFLLAAALPLAAIGCTEATTSKDVADARKDVQEEQKDLDEARCEAMKPTIEDNENIQEEKRDVVEAQAELTQTQREFAANQARDQFALEAQKTLDAADREIEALKTRADGEEGAAKEATQQQIDDLKTRRDRLDDAVGNLKKADLAKWNDHKAEVQTAMKELSDKVGARR